MEKSGKVRRIALELASGNPGLSRVGGFSAVYEDHFELSPSPDVTILPWSPEYVLRDNMLYKFKL